MISQPAKAPIKGGQSERLPGKNNNAENLRENASYACSASV